MRVYEYDVLEAMEGRRGRKDSLDTKRDPNPGERDIEKQVVRFQTDQGAIFEVRPTNDGQGIAIRNAEENWYTGLAVFPEVSSSIVVTHASRGDERRCR